MHKCPKLTTKDECIGREMCGWNDATNKCRKKSVRKSPNPETQLNQNQKKSNAQISRLKKTV
jgi:hypothetical protein